MLQRRKDLEKSRKLKSRHGSCQKSVHFKILTIIPLTLLQRSSFPVWVFPSTEGNHLYIYAIAGSYESMSWPNTPSPTCNKSSARNPRSFTKTKSSWDSWTSNHTVDGRNPVGSLSHYLQGSKHSRWYRISSINSSLDLSFSGAGARWNSCLSSIKCSNHFETHQ